MNRSLLASALCLSLTVTACGDKPGAVTAAAGDVAGGAPASQEVASLKLRIAALEKENTELRMTPAILAAAVEAAGSDVAKATAAAAALRAKYPSSPEAAAADKQVAALVEAAEQAKAEARRLAALGLKAVKVTPKFMGEEAGVEVSGATLAKRWVFDAYDSQYHYKEAEKGSMYVTAKLKVTSKNKDPKIPGMALYKADGANLVKVEFFMLKFARWDGFGSYLGNETDYRNDFSHSTSIPFVMGAQFEIDAVEKPLFIVVSKAPCYDRNYERFNQPPVSYSRDTCAGLNDTLTAADFADGKLGVLARID